MEWLSSIFSRILYSIASLKKNSPDLYFHSSSSSLTSSRFPWVSTSPIIFVASVGQDIAGSLPIAIVASLLYGWLIYKSNPGIQLYDSKILIRIPFLFIISLISSYWSQSTRRELQKKEELERFNRELKKEVERVAAEEIELRRYNEKIINSVMSGVIAVSNDGIITTLNPVAEKTLGLKKTEAIGQDIKNFSELTPLWEKMNQCMKNGNSIKRDEVAIKNKNNEKIPIGFSMSPITGAKERFSGCVVIFKDLSGIRALEEKLKRAERLSYLGKMASWVAHESSDCNRRIRATAGAY